MMLVLMMLALMMVTLHRKMQLTLRPLLRQRHHLWLVRPSGQRQRRSGAPLDGTRFAAALGTIETTSGNIHAMPRLWKLKLLATGIAHGSRAAVGHEALSCSPLG